MRRVFLVLVVAGLSWPTGRARAQVVCDDVTVSGPVISVDTPIISVGVGPLVTTHSTTCRTRRRVVQAVPPPPPPPMAPPPPPPAPVRVVAAPPPPPPAVRVVPPFRRLGFTLGFYVDSPLYADGALTGGALQFRYRVLRELAITTTVSGLTSCSRCHKDALDFDRRDVTLTLGLMYFPFPRWVVAPYARAALVTDFITFRVDGVKDSYTQVGMESGLGFEWRLSRHLALFADASAVVLGGAKKPHTEYGELVTTRPALTSSEKENMKGVPLLTGNSDVAARLRLGLVFKF